MGAINGILMGVYAVVLPSGSAHDIFFCEPNLSFILTP